MPFITSARLKAERAGVHLEELERMAADFLDKNSDLFRRQLNPQNLDNYVYEIPQQAPPPLDISVVIGDVAHNLRSALDNIAWQLALLTTSEPYPQTAFPILVDTSIESVNTFKRLTKDVLPDALRIIEAVQPYHRGDAAIWDELWILHLIWNEDKHRLLTTIPVRVTVPVFSGRGGSFVTLKDGTKRVEIPRSQEPEKNFEPGITREILLEIPRLKERVRLNVIRGIYHVVSGEIIPLFSRFLAESGDNVERVQGFVKRTH